MKKYISVLTVLCSLAVVLLHSNGCFWTFSYESYWISANIIESVFYFAVPIFFMISGATLLDYHDRYDTKTFFIKRVKKTVIPFLAWSVIGLLYMLYYKVYSVSEIGERFLINNILNTNIISIYWYFIPQFAVYLFFPFLSGICKDKRKEVFLYIIIVYLVFNAVLPLCFSIVGLTYNSDLRVPITGYVIYTIAGYYIDNYKIPLKYRRIIYLSGAAGLLLHIIGTWYLSYRTGAIVDLYKGYVNLPCILYSFAIFTFFKYHKTWNIKLLKIVNFFDGTTLGIYLIHWFLLDQCNKWFPFISPLSLFYRVIIGLIIFVLSAGIIKAFQKIPIIRMIVPK